jgi:hypothetical protein
VILRIQAWVAVMKQDEAGGGKKKKKKKLEQAELLLKQAN